MKIKKKTRKSAYKRIKKKKTILLRKKAYKGHLLRKKNSKHLRRLRSAAQVHPSDLQAFSGLLPYGA
jgi:ribosomal protein L35